MVDLYTVAVDNKKWTALTWREATRLLRDLHERGVFDWVMWHYDIGDGE